MHTQTETSVPLAGIVIKAVADHYKTTPEKLVTGKSEKITRQVVVHLLKEVFNQSVKSIEQTLGISQPTVYTYASEAKKAIENDREVAEAVEAIRTEVLISTSVPGTPAARGEEVAAGNRPLPASPAQAQVPSPRPESAPSGPKPPAAASPKAETIQKMVSETYLGFALLSDPDPLSKIAFVRALSAYLLWKDFGETKESVMSSLGLDEKGFFAAIGRIHFSEKEDEEARKQIESIRKKCLS